jgi:hypothetical protein
MKGYWNITVLIGSYTSPNETISVKVLTIKYIYGSYMEFLDEKIRWTTQTLSQSIKNKILDDEQFWNILNFDQWVVFQSLNRIYIYDTKSR